MQTSISNFHQRSCQGCWHFRRGDRCSKDLGIYALPTAENDCTEWRARWGGNRVDVLNELPRGGRSTLDN